jgi:septal ring factor EnvC (AmiA/AmiB activator)
MMNMDFETGEMVSDDELRAAFEQRFRALAQLEAEYNATSKKLNDLAGRAAQARDLLKAAEDRWSRALKNAVRAQA